jgi:hypothetical protein
MTVAGIASAAQLSVVHGIPGQELGVDPALAVDVSVNGACTLEGFEFTEIAGPLDLDAGVYDIEVTLADTANPCQGPLAIAQSISLALGENASAVAHFTTDGSIQLSKFTNDVRAPAEGQARFVARHLADAPDVDAPFEVEGETVAQISALGFGEQGKLDVDAGTYEASVKVAGTDVTALGPYSVNAMAGAGYYVYIVGSVSGGTLMPLVQHIDL